MRLAVAVALAACHSAEPPPPTPPIAPPVAPLGRSDRPAAVCATSRVTRPLERVLGTRRDAAGDLLPEHAIARLGSSRMRTGAEITLLEFCGDVLLTGDAGAVVHAFDRKTGAPRGTWHLATDMLTGVVRLQCVAGVPHATTTTGQDARIDLATGALAVRELGKDIVDAVQVADDDVMVLARRDAPRGKHARRRAPRVERQDARGRPHVPRPRRQRSWARVVAGGRSPGRSR